MQTCLFAVHAQWFCGSHCWLNCVEFENIENCYFCWDCHFFGDNYFYRRVYSLDTVQDFLIKLVIKPCLHLFKISISFTKSCHRQTYQNYEQPPQSLQNFYFQSNFLASKINFFFYEEYMTRKSTFINEFFWKFWFSKFFVFWKCTQFFLAQSIANSTLLTNKQGNIHVLRNYKGGEGVRKWQFLITFSTERNHKGGRGGQKTWMFPKHFSISIDYKSNWV